MPPFCLSGLESALAESILIVLGPALLAGKRWRAEPDLRKSPKNPGVGAHFGLACSPLFDMILLPQCSVDLVYPAYPVV